MFHDGFGSCGLSHRKWTLSDSTLQGHHPFQIGFGFYACRRRADCFKVGACHAAYHIAREPSVIRCGTGASLYRLFSFLIVPTASGLFHDGFGSCGLSHRKWTLSDSTLQGHHPFQIGFGFYACRRRADCFKVGACHAAYHITREPSVIRCGTGAFLCRLFSFF